MSAAAFVQAFAQAARAKNGEAMADLLAVTTAASLPTAPESEVHRRCQSLPGPLASVAAAHLLACGHVASGNAVEAFEQQLEACQRFRDLLNSRDHKGRWLLRPLEVVAKDLRVMAYQADDASSKNECTEKALAEIREAFTACLSDRCPDPSDTLMRGVLFLMSNLLSISFRLNNFANTKGLIKAVQADRVQPMFRDRVNGFPLSHRVTYQYYLGRNALFQADYAAANENLTYAFEHCHRDSLHNKRLVLVYLTPVKLRLGQLPTDRLLEKYNLPQFVGITHAVRTGDLRMLRDELQAHQRFFVRWGIYMTLEKLRFIAYRNLFKRVFVSTVAPDAKPLIAISDLQAALNWLQERQVDLDETECIVANLIHKKYIKGYISHAQKTLVVSKKDAFPLLRNVPAF